MKNKDIIRRLYKRLSSRFGLKIMRAQKFDRVIRDFNRMEFELERHIKRVGILEVQRDQTRKKLSYAKKEQRESKDIIKKINKENLKLQKRTLNLKRSRDLSRIQYFETKKALKVKVARSKFAECLMEGEDFNNSVLTYIRSAIDAGDSHSARSFSHALISISEYSLIGYVASGILSLNDGFTETAMKYFDLAGVDSAISLAPVEFFTTAIRNDYKEYTSSLEECIEENIASSKYEKVFDLIKLFYVADQQRLFEQWIARLINVGERKMANDYIEELLWIRDRLNEKKRTKSAIKHLRDNINIAVIDYKMMDKGRASSNHGDYVQTLASIGHLCRFKNVNFGEENELGVFLNQIKSNIPIQWQLDSPEVNLNPVIIDRDFSSGRHYTKNTWLICFGWQMHPNFKQVFDFPYPKEINPIFISFHISRHEILTEEGVSYLQEHQPIGCRDWTTVYLLRERGVKAFFSGCITTTVGSWLPKKDKNQKSEETKVAAVEAKYRGSSKNIVEFTHAESCVRDTPLVESLNIVKNLLEQYITSDQVVTSRLHCYLPCKSLGLDVVFDPKNKSDYRFEGLLDLSDIEVQRISARIEEKIQSVYASIFSGASKTEVYRLWAEICAEDVIAAENYCNDYSAIPKLSFDLDSMLTALYESKHSFNVSSDVGVNVAFSIDENLKDQLPVAIQSMQDNSDCMFNITVLTRGLDVDYFTEISGSFPEIHFVFYMFDLIDYGENIRLLKHTSVSTIDRLLLPELLQEKDKILYLDVDLSVLANISELYRLDIGDLALAAKPTTSFLSRGTRMIYLASLGLEPKKSWNLRRLAHASGSLSFKTFNAGVMLMNLKKMRDDSFTRQFIPYVEHAKMNDQDVLNLYTRDQYKALDPEWNSVPSQEDCSAAKIIHWAGAVKPWSKLSIAYKDVYEYSRDKYIARSTANDE